MKRLLGSILALVVLLTPILSVDAHSGRTDSSGGHNCSEKSKRKGLCTGYHYHNGGSSSSDRSSSRSSISPKPSTKQQTKQNHAPVVVKKTIVAVDKASVLVSPYDTNVSTTLWYGYEIKDIGSYYNGFITIEQGYISKNLLTQYNAIKAKTVKVQAEKGYFFSTPSASSVNRGNAVKGSVVSVVGESNGFYFGSTKDAEGKVLVGFISKTVAY